MNPAAVPNAYSHVPSPCVGVCRMDEANRRCVGCLRSREEIGNWGGMADREKFVLLAQLAQRGNAPPAAFTLSLPDA